MAALHAWLRVDFDAAPEGAADHRRQQGSPTGAWVRRGEPSVRGREALNSVRARVTAPPRDTSRARSIDECWSARGDAHERAAAPCVGSCMKPRMGTAEHPTTAQSTNEYPATGIVGGARLARAFPPSDAERFVSGSLRDRALPLPVPDFLKGSIPSRAWVEKDSRSPPTDVAEARELLIRRHCYAEFFSHQFEE